MRFVLKIIPFILISISVLALNKEERKQLFKEATQRLKETNIEKRALQKGDVFPDLDLGGKKVSTLVENGPVLFTVYRGGWCPYCVRQLKELNTNLNEFAKYKLQIFAIAPETEKETSKTKRKNDLSFTILSDKDHKILRSLNLVFKVEDAVVQEYKNLGINLENSQGNNNNELPVPATYLINKDRIIIYSFVDADYTKRAKVEDIVEALKKN